MPVTLTIKRVPDSVADALRQRAQANRRSLQRELLLIAEEAADQRGMRVSEPSLRAWSAPVRTTHGVAKKVTGGRLNLEQLWRRARKLGAGFPAESAAIVRNDRDAPDRR
jgi:hypothetical protein